MTQESENHLAELGMTTMDDTFKKNIPPPRKMHVMPAVRQSKRDEFRAVVKPVNRDGQVITRRQSEGKMAILPKNKPNGSISKSGDRQSERRNTLAACQFEDSLRGLNEAQELRALSETRGLISGTLLVVYR